MPLTRDERAARKQESTMQNWFAVESEVAFRRQEWESLALADARAESARVEQVKPRGLSLPRISFAGLKALSVPRLSLVGPAATRSGAADCAC